MKAWLYVYTPRRKKISLYKFEADIKNWSSIFVRSEIVRSDGKGVTTMYTTVTSTPGELELSPGGVMKVWFPERSDILASTMMTKQRLKALDAKQEKIIKSMESVNDEIAFLSKELIPVEDKWHES